MNSSGVSNWFKTRVTLNNLFRLFLGQVVSFVLALTSFTSSLIASLGVDAPITQTSFTYFTLAVVYGSILLHRGQKLRVPWYWYLALGFVDVQGNYLVNKAFQFSSITSVTLLDCWTIVWAIILTYIFIGTRYSLWQLGGAALCVLGLGLVLLSDAGVGGGGGSKPLLGDTLVIAVTLFFSMSNVGEEFCVKKKDRVEVVSMIGLYGLLVSGVELYPISACLDYIRAKELGICNVVCKYICFQMLALAVYTLSTFLFYTRTPFVLKLSGATMFNLSLLTSDMWAVVVQILFYRQKVDWLYFVAFGLVVIGLVIYSTTKGEGCCP
ncbi:Solute carrier family 35 member F2 isoform 3 [Hibiscus syriacus]|uniref:Solute carrier family 35 member F2 isoform 3 n=1 Tax=Hibiscus syriacus TaxID=106335 RepID=A0A6A2Y055_HIBSY|nr:Solute carrier family 35 member F2 isoform 3 [Hibiscus syriacus]